MKQQKEAIVKVDISARRIVSASALMAFSFLLLYKSEMPIGTITVYGLIMMLISLLKVNDVSIVGSCAITVVCATSSFVLMQHELGASVYNLNIRFIFCGIVICLICILFLCWLFSSFCLGNCIGMIFFLLFSTIDYYIIIFRGAEITPSDFHSIQTAMTVANGYNVEISLDVAITWTILSVILLALTGIKFERIKRWSTLPVFVLTIIILGIITNALLKDVSSARFGKDGSLYRGLVVNYYLETKESSIKKPEKYQPAMLKEEVDNCLLGGDNNSTIEESPNIIVIMNESFADLNHYGENLETDIAVMPYLNSLEENTVKGFALASVFGGNTANSEYEFLTGNTMAFLPNGSIPYTQWVENKSYSMIGELHKYGYKCIAMHPYYSHCWNRAQVYPKFGFDESFFIDSFSQKSLKRGFISDQSFYKGIIKKCESNTDSPLFVFGVTIQNHGGYWDEDYKPCVQLKGLSHNYYDAEQYLSLIHESDEAIKYLINYFQKQEKRTIIVFFGDHLPKLEDAFYSEIHTAKDRNIDETLRKMEIPFFIWANYDIEEKNDEVTSINYLSKYIYEIIGVNPAYNSLLSEISEVIPAICSEGYLSKAKGTYEMLDAAEGEEREAIDFYKRLQYNNIFDKKNKLEIFKFE